MLSLPPPLAGGALIGLSAVLLLVLNGRVAGVSEIVGGLFKAIDARLVTNVAFVIGLLLARNPRNRPSNVGRSVSAYLDTTS
jgi:uncharacterized membrane protein YedE/YeeE